MTWDDSASWIMPSSCAVCALRRLLLDKPCSCWMTLNIMWDMVFELNVNLKMSNHVQCILQPIYIDFQWLTFECGSGWQHFKGKIVYNANWRTSINNELHGRFEEWCSNFRSACGNVLCHAKDTFSIAWLTVHILTQQSYLSKPWLTNLCKVVVLATWLCTAFP